MAKRNQRTDPAGRSAGAPATESESMASEPSEADIRLRAYWRYLERGRNDGMDFDDWLEAERELTARANTARQPAVTASF